MAEALASINCLVIYSLCTVAFGKYISTDISHRLLPISPRRRSENVYQATEKNTPEGAGNVFQLQENIWTPGLALYPK